MAFMVSNQQYVSGTARLKLFKGHAMIVGRKSEHSLYRHELATYEEGDQYDSSAALGFIKIHGLGQTTQAKHQLLKGRPARGSNCPASSRQTRRSERHSKPLKAGTRGLALTARRQSAK